MLAVTIPVVSVPINVRWSEEVGASRRLALEAEFGLADPTALDGNTWAYLLRDHSRASIRAIVQHPLVADTHHVDRARFAPSDGPMPRGLGIMLGALLFAAGGVAVPRWLAGRLRQGRFWTAAAATAALVWMMARLLPLPGIEANMAAAPWTPSVLVLAVAALAAVERRVQPDARAVIALLAVPPLALLLAALLVFAGAVR